MSRTYSRGRRALVTAAALAGLALIGVVAGCGGGGGSKGTKTTPAPVDQVVNGTGYTFAAPARWRILTTSHGVSVSGARWQLLTVGVYKLVKPYAPTRFEATARELDGVAASLAAGRKGKVTSRETRTVAGGHVRSYRIDYAVAKDNLTQQVTFVLRGTTEWLLVCRRAAADPDGPCAGLLTSFELKPA